MRGYPNLNTSYYLPVLKQVVQEYLSSGTYNMEIIFIHILLEVVRVLVYAYRFASISAITKEMSTVPSNILFEIIHLAK